MASLAVRAPRARSALRVLRPTVSCLGALGVREREIARVANAAQTPSRPAAAPPSHPMAAHEEAADALLRVRDLASVSRVGPPKSPGDVSTKCTAAQLGFVE
jgi:hypothetical protein